MDCMIYGMCDDIKVYRGKTVTCVDIACTTECRNDTIIHLYVGSFFVDEVISSPVRVAVLWVLTQSAWK